MNLQLEADQATLRQNLTVLCPDFPRPPAVKAQLLDYQMLALFLLAQECNRSGARILEIGTGHGSSGYLLSRAAPRARITSLTTSAAEAIRAGHYWQEEGCRNIAAHVVASWDFLARNVETWDLVFVDGDHNQIARDLPWFDRLREGGLLLCHDYSPQDSRSPSGIVYAELNAMAARLGRPFDVRLVDEHKIGMAGFYRGDQGAPPALVTSPRILTAPPPRPTRAQLSGSGVVGHADADAPLRHQAATAGVAAILSHSWDLPWPRTLFAASSAIVPWDLVPAGFHLVETWDLAVPLALPPRLAHEVGTEADRAETERVVGDLRIPRYCTDLIFVRDSEPGRACLACWRDQCAAGGESSLAFLRALFMIKPRLCALPRLWLAPAEERATLNGQTARKPGLAAKQLRRRG